MDAERDLPWFVLDVPRPPSVNRYVKKLGNKSPAVKAWVAQADNALMLRKPYPHISGWYEIQVTLSAPDFARYDPDNILKALNDWLQRVELIENDKYARRLVIEWGEAPEGCRVKLRPWVHPQ